MKHDLSRGPAHVADTLTGGLRPRRPDETVLESVFAARAEDAQRARRLQFIADQRLSPAEAVHIPPDFDPSKENA